MPRIAFKIVLRNKKEFIQWLYLIKGCTNVERIMRGVVTTFLEDIIPNTPVISGQLIEGWRIAADRVGVDFSNPGKNRARQEIGYNQGRIFIADKWKKVTVKNEVPYAHKILVSKYNILDRAILKAQKTLESKWQSKMKRIKK